MKDQRSSEILRVSQAQEPLLEELLAVKFVAVEHTSI